MDIDGQVMINPVKKRWFPSARFSWLSYLSQENNTRNI